MPSDIAISVRNLTKTFRIFGHPGDRIKQVLTLGRVRFHREFTALKDVSFDVKKGETVGIIGRNGSGKSTLLQLICGIIKPTSGTVTVNGRVSALLELGAGFNPEFTGRENVYFQGALMGFTKAQMDERFDDIATFADIGEFIDQPVRTYSSGMFVRLAFAVAIHVAPDILVIDEALAVGDARFQNKCMSTVKRFRDNGTAVLLVSHDLGAIRSQCDRAAHIHRGCLMALGTPSKICDGYLREIRMGEGEPPLTLLPSESEDIQAPAVFRIDEMFMKAVASSRYGSGEVQITAVETLDEAGLPIEAAEFGQTIRIRLHIYSKEDCPINVAYHLKDRTGLSILSSSILLETGKPLSLHARHGVVAEFITPVPLMAASYVLLAQITRTGSDGPPSFVDVVENAMILKIMDRHPHPVWSKVHLKNELVLWK